MMFTYNNLVGDVSLSLVDPLSWELRFLLNSSLAIDLVLTSGDFSECSDSEFSCSVLTDRPLKAIMYRMILLLNAKRLSGGNFDYALWLSVDPQNCLEIGWKGFFLFT